MRPVIAGGALWKRTAGLQFQFRSEQDSSPALHKHLQYRRVKARNVRHFSARLQDRWQAFCEGAISFAEFDSSVQGWINHVRYADSWGLRKHVLGKALIKHSATE